MKNLQKLFTLIFAELLLFQACATADESFINELRRSVPASQGRISEIHVASPDNRWVIHIQDAHCNYSAQKNTARILDKLQRWCGLSAICIEGASGAIDTSPIRSFPVQSSRDSVADYLLQTGDITGAEYYSITCDAPVSLDGVEDAGIYNDNRTALINAVSVKQAIDRVFGMLHSAISAYRNTLYTEELTQIEQWHISYDNTVELISLLSKHISILPDRYPALSAILANSELEKSMSFSEVHEQSEWLSVELSARSNLISENIRKESLLFNLGQSDEQTYYSKLLHAAQESSIDIDNYPAVQQYAKWLENQSRITHDALSEEISSLANELINSDIYTPQQKALFQFSQLVRYAEKWVHLEITESTTAGESELNSGKLYSLAKTVDPRLAQEIELYLPLIDRAVEEARPFYTAALKRDDVIAKNTLNILHTSTAPCIGLVSGGFHTSGITEILKEQGVNYAVIVPRIENFSDRSTYLNRMLNRQSGWEASLTRALFSLGTPSLFAYPQTDAQKSVQMIKIAKAQALMITTAADELGSGTDASDAIVLEKLNAVLDGYNSGSIQITEIKRAANNRFYRVRVKNSEFIFYFHGTGAPIDTLASRIADDVGSIIQELSLGNSRVTILKDSILTALSEFFSDMAPSGKNITGLFVNDEDIARELSEWQRTQELPVFQFEREESPLEQTIQPSMTEKVKSYFSRRLPQLMPRTSEIKASFSSYGMIGIVGLLTMMVDWGTKIFFNNFLAGGKRIDLSDDFFIEIVGHYFTLKEIFFTATESLGLMVLGAYLISKAKLNTLAKIGAGFIGGAWMGNFIETLTRGYVIDWLGRMYPNGEGIVANFADLILVVGAYLLFMSTTGFPPSFKTSENRQEYGYGFWHRMFARTIRIIGLASLFVGVAGFMFQFQPVLSGILIFTGWFTFVPKKLELMDVVTSQKELNFHWLDGPHLHIWKTVLLMAGVSIATGIGAFGMGFSPILPGLLIVSGIYPLVRSILELNHAANNKKAQPEPSAQPATRKNTQHRVLMIDADSVLINWEALSAFRYTLAHAKPGDTATLVLYSLDKDMEAINSALADAGITIPEKNSLILAGKTVDYMLDANISVTEYIQDLYDISPEQIMHVSSADTKTETPFTDKMAVTFNIIPTGGLPYLLQTFSIVFDSLESHSLPEGLSILSASENNRHSAVLNSNEKIMTLADLNNYVTSSLNRSITLDDISGLTIGIAPQPQTASAERKNVYGHQLLDTSL
jgi:lipoprotein signal peptidase